MHTGSILSSLSKPSLRTLTTLLLLCIQQLAVPLFVLW